MVPRSIAKKIAHTTKEVCTPEGGGKVVVVWRDMATTICSEPYSISRFSDDGGYEFAIAVFLQPTPAAEVHRLLEEGLW